MDQELICKLNRHAFHEIPVITDVSEIHSDPQQVSCQVIRLNPADMISYAISAVCHDCVSKRNKRNTTSPLRVILHKATEC